MGQCDQVTPFSRSGKKEQAKCMQRMAEHIHTVQEQMSFWLEDLDPKGGPVLQAAGFKLSMLEKLVSRAKNVESTTAVDHAKQQIGQLKIHLQQADKLIASIPDPEEASESKFLKFMSKHGTNLANHKAELERLREVAAKSVDTAGDKDGDLDPDDVLSKSITTAGEILQLILLFTLLTLLRNPCIRNPQETTLRGNAISVRQQMIDLHPSCGDLWWKKYREEALEVFGPEETTDEAEGGSDEAKLQGRARGRGRGGRAKGGKKAPAADKEPPAADKEPPAKRRRGTT